MKIFVKINKVYKAEILIGYPKVVFLSVGLVDIFMTLTNLSIFVADCVAFVEKNTKKRVL